MYLYIHELYTCVKSKKCYAKHNKMPNTKELFSPSDTNAKQEDIVIASLDPLNADEMLRSLPVMNVCRDISGLVQLGEAIVPTPLQSNGFTRNESRAALRDLGMVAASIKRHGIEPVRVVPGLQEALISGGLKAGTVPRDTVLSYGAWNPDDQRRRKFTVLPDEDLFIDSFKRGSGQLDQSVVELLNTQDMDLQDSGFESAVNRSSKHFEQMIGAIVAVRRHITPEVFTGELRPYFEPYLVGERSYLAPGGAQMPVLLIDQIMWGSDTADTQYQQYLIENTQYLPEEMRDLSTNLSQKESMVSRVKRECAEKDTLQPQEQKSLGAMVDLTNKLIAFRRPHLALAKANFALRSEKDNGSGGYKPDILEVLIDHTEKARQSIKNVMKG